jgi:hypothetical protein
MFRGVVAGSLMLLAPGGRGYRALWVMVLVLHDLTSWRMIRILRGSILTLRVKTRWQPGGPAGPRVAICAGLAE